LRKAIMSIWCVCFCGMQWRAIGPLSGIPFATLYTLFARWTRPGLWRQESAGRWSAPLAGSLSAGG